MKKWMLAGWFLACGVGTCAAEAFYLKHQTTGQTYGPFEFSNGAQVKIGAATFTIVRAPAAGMTTGQKLKQTMIPEIDFREAAVADVVEFLRRASVDFSPETEHKGVNLILNLRERKEAAPRITFKARHLSLEQVLDAVAGVAELKWRVDGNFVMIEPRE